MRFERRLSSAESGPYDDLTFASRQSEIRNPDGSVVFSMADTVVPESWSQVSVDVLVQKYFRKTGVPQQDEHGDMILQENGQPLLGPERDARQIFDRLAGCWTEWGRRYGYFDSEEDAAAFNDELRYMLAHQMVAPNSPQWFNTGLYSAYGIEGPAQGHWFVDPDTGEITAASNAYERPQPHACFIQSIDDDLVNNGGIMDLWIREARLFKYGSGTGSNFSKIRARGEALSGGGQSSGLMSFLKVGDRAAWAIKSGGTTRRAAKMVCLDIDHPDVEDFIRWKVVEERKVAAMVTGSRNLKKYLDQVIDACFDGQESPNADMRSNPDLAKAVTAARGRGVPDGAINRVLQLAAQGIREYSCEVFDTDWEGEAYHTVSGQSSNNSVRLSREFLEALEKDEEWQLTARTDGRVTKKVRARELWDMIVASAWECADPGVQLDSTINEWHTCPAGGRINASNPCSEYMFLDDTACNLASLNLVSFLTEDGTFDSKLFAHAVRIWTTVLEISVLMASYPSQRVAELSYRYRTLGLGYANLGSLLMRLGLAYDSDRGRNLAAAITAIMTGEAYAISAEMAAELGPFPAYEENREAMLRVIRNHRRAAYNTARDEYEGLSVTPTGIDPKYVTEELLRDARRAWDRALELGKRHGFRNAQTTVLAPTGTISLVMDCDTTGIEPDYALVKFRKLAGGGYFKIINQAIPAALDRLGYSQEESAEIVAHAVGHASLQGCPSINHEALRSRGFDDAAIARIEKALPTVFDLRGAFLPTTIGAPLLSRLGISDADLQDLGFDLLGFLGFSEEEITAASIWACGTMAVEGAPQLKDAHLPVFDCANRCGRFGSRFIRYQAHIKMMSAVQPFISGAISKTINLPRESTISDVDEALRLAWQSMLKALAIFRDGSKLSQPITAGLPAEHSADLVSAVANGDVTELAETMAERVVVKHLARRQALPTRRAGYTQKARVGGHKIYLRTGEYQDGSLGEIFLDMHREGAAYRSLMNCFAIAVSLGLQYGVPLDEFVDAFLFTRFEPNGMVDGNDQIRMATSVIDYIFRELAITYLDRTDLAHVTHEDTRHDSVTSSQTTQTEPASKKVERALPVAVGQSSQPAPVSTPRASAASAMASFSSNARAMGYEGDPCGECGNLTMVRNGTCLKCNTCGATSGCS
jgi:ribonucleoside-diphosphate reductase alpha chain